MGIAGSFSGSALAQSASAPEKPPMAITQIPTDWIIIQSDIGKRSNKRLLVPPNETASNWTVQAREERFKGLADTMSATQLAETLQNALGNSCKNPKLDDKLPLQIGKYSAILLRMDCPSLKSTGEVRIIMASIWAEGSDLQTKQVVFKSIPDETQVAAAKVFLGKRAKAIAWKSDI